jgi:hypothetical protein
LSSRKDPRGDHTLPIRSNEDWQFDQSQREMQTCMDLKVFRNGFHALANAIADYQQKEATPPKICGQSVVEIRLINFMAGFADQFQQGISGAS